MTDRLACGTLMKLVCMAGWYVFQTSNGTKPAMSEKVLSLPRGIHSFTCVSDSIISPFVYGLFGSHYFIRPIFTNR